MKTQNRMNVAELAKDTRMWIAVGNDALDNELDAFERGFEMGFNKALALIAESGIIPVPIIHKK